MMTGSIRRWTGLCLVALASGATLSIGQVAQGGSPWKWGTNLDLSTIPSVTTEALDLAVLEAEDAVTDQYKEAPWRFGVECDVDFGLDNAGIWIHEKDRWIWRLAIECPDATGIGLTLGTFDLPAGARLFVWNEDRTRFLGSFTEANEKAWGYLPLGYWTTTSWSPITSRSPSMALAMCALANRPRIPQPALHPENPAAEARMGPSATRACNINVNCPSGADGKRKKGGRLITNGGYAVCTGALVNNTPKMEHRIS